MLYAAGSSHIGFPGAPGMGPGHQGRPWDDMPEYKGLGLTCE
jgi:hypothetical protein